MKKSVIALVAVIAAVLFSAPSYAQKIVNTPTAAPESFVPSMTIRPLTASERTRLSCVKAFSITAGCTAGIAAAATVGAIAYDVEYREALGNGSSFQKAADYDNTARKYFVIGAAASAGVAVLSGITAISIKATMRHTTIVKASAGGFAIEF